MQTSDLLASLRIDADVIALTPRTPSLGDLATVLSDVVDHTETLEISQVVLDHETPRDQLALHGQAVVFGLPMAVRLVIALRGGVVRAFHLVAIPDANWALRTAFPKLTTDIHGADLLAVALRNPAIVVSAGRPEIARVSADGPLDVGSGGPIVLDDGVHLIAAGTHEPLPLEGFLPVPAHPLLETARGRAAGRVEGVFSHDGRRRSLSIKWWWPVQGAPHAMMPDASHRAIGLTADALLEGPEHCSPNLTWLQDFAPNDGGPGMHLQWAWTPKAQPEFSATLESPRIAEDPEHVSRLAADPAFGAFPCGLALTGMSDGPSSFSFTATPWDRANSRPAEWEVIPGLLRFHEAHVHVHCSLSPNAPPDRSVVVYGAASLLDCEGLMFDVEFAPGASLRASLHAPEHLDPLAIIERFLGRPSGLPHVDLTLLSLVIEQDLSTHARSLALSIGGRVDLLGNGLFILDGVELQVARAEKKIVARSISGEIEIAGRPIRISGSWDETLGWLIQGGLGRGATISLDRLVRDLLHRFDAELPFELPRVELYRLGVAFATRTRAFRAYASTRWTPPRELPWATGELDVNLEVQVEKSPNESSRSVALILDWTWDAAGRRFESHAVFARGASNFTVTWVSDDATRLTLSELFGALKLDKVAALPAGHDWTLFAFHEVTACFDQHAKQLNLRARSPLGSGELEIDAVLGRHASQFEAKWSGAKPEARIGVDMLLDAVGLGADPVLDELRRIGRDVFSFHKVGFTYLSAPEPTLLFDCESSHAEFGRIFVAARPAAGRWGVVVGAAFRQHTQLGDVKVLGDIPFVGDILKALVVEPVYVLASSLDATGFPTPPIGDAAGESPFHAGTLDVRKGVALAVALDIGRSTNAAVRRIHQVIGVDRLEGRISFSTNHAEVLAKIPGSLHIPTGLAGDLILVDPYVDLLFQSGGPAFRLGGSGSARIFGSLHEFKAALTASPESLDCSIYQKDGVPLPKLGGLPGLRIKRDYWLELGVDFEPTGVDLGFQGQFFIGDDPNKYSGDLVIVLTFVEEVPDPQYLAGSIDQLDLWAMFELQTGAMRFLSETGDKMAAIGTAADSVEKTRALGSAARLSASGLEFLRGQFKNLQSVLSFFTLHDVAFHFCERPGVVLPDGSAANVGLGVRGWCELFGWRAFARLEFSTSSTVPQLSGELQGAPIELAVGGFTILRITGDGKGVPKPALAPKAMTQRDAIGVSAPAPAAHPEFLVAPGGPNLIVSSQHSPFLHANLVVELLGALKASVKADVTDKGFEFRMHGGLGDIATVDLDCALHTEPAVRFDAHGRYGMHLNLDTGPIIPGLDFTAIHLDAGLDATLTMSVTKDDFRVTVEGAFEFEGATIDMPTLTIDVPFASLKELPGRVLDWIKEKAATIFSDLFHGVGEALAAVGKEVAAIAQAGAKLCVEAFDRASTAIKEVGETVGRAASAAAQEVEKAAGELANKAKAIVADAAKEVLAVGRRAAEEAEALARAAKAALVDAARTVAAAAAAVAEEVGRIAHRIADIASHAAAMVADIARAAAAEIAAIAHEAEVVAQELFHAAQAVVDDLERAAKKVWDEINEIIDRAKRIAESLKHGVEDAWHTATSWI